MPKIITKFWMYILYIVMPFSSDLKKKVTMLQSWLKQKWSRMNHMHSFDISERQEKIVILKHIRTVPNTRNKFRWVNSLLNKIWNRVTGCSNFRSIVISCCSTPLYQSILWIALIIIQEQQWNTCPEQGKIETGTFFTFCCCGNSGFKWNIQFKCF